MVEKKGTRRTVDKWKKKKWFTITASKMFDGKSLGETPAEKPINLVGRTIKVTMDVLTGQRTRRDIKISFKTNDVQGQKITTTISQFETNKASYGRALRRRNSKVALIEKIPVKGGDARVTTVIITVNKATQKQKTGLRALMKKEMAQFKDKDFEDVVSDLLIGKFSSDLHRKAGKICLVKKAVVAKATFTEAK